MSVDSTQHVSGCGADRKLKGKMKELEHSFVTEMSLMC